MIFYTHFNYDHGKSHFGFRLQCSNILRKDVLIQWEKHMTFVLCHIEMIFPHFFDDMVHLSIHVTREALLGETIYYRYL